MQLENLAIIAGLAVGVLMVLAVLIVFVRKQALGGGGLALALLGVVLIGMGVWGNIRVSAAGVELDVVRQEVRRTAAAAAAVAAAADSIVGAVEVHRVGLRTLAEQLEGARVITRPQLDAISQLLTPVPVDRARLDTARMALDSTAIRLNPRKLERRP